MISRFQGRMCGALRRNAAGPGAGCYPEGVWVTHVFHAKGRLDC